MDVSDEKAFDLFKRKADVIAALDVDGIVIDFARTPYWAAEYSDAVNAVLDLTDDEIDYVRSNYPELEVSVAINPAYRGGVSQDANRIKMHGGKVLRWENHDNQYTLGVESSDEGYFIFPVKPTSWWDVGGWTSVDLAELLVHGTNASPAVVFLHTPLSHDDYLSYSIQGVIGPGERNQCPILEPIDNIGVRETGLVTIVAHATDAENDGLTYYIGDSGFDQNYNIFTWQTQEGDTGSYNVLISVSDNSCQDSQTVKVVVTPLSCGDIDNDDNIDIVDGVYFVNYLFNGGPAPNCIPITACGDVNLDGQATIADLVYWIRFFFKKGSLPCYSL